MPLDQASDTTNTATSTQEIRSTQVTELLKDAQGKVLYEATYDVAPDKSLKLVNQTWNDEALRQLNEGTTEPATATRSAGATAVEAGKLVWQIIKDNRAVAITDDTKTYVLSDEDTNPLHYVEAQHGESPKFTWLVCDSLIESIVYVDITISASGYLHGKPISTSPAPKGFYLPSVYFNVSRCDVNFPVTAKGYANLESPVNVGTEHESIAEIRMHAKLTAEWVFQSLNISVGFKANGKTGFWYLGLD